ncbi:flagellum transition zone component, putative [Trypanosoma cruzi marinkellei]|uniref:Flagellum transition zone component, putative n=1 Tax=Trypanosoma cruzi marinkellei TaxID=85056 RepID=K2NCW1_TRYCR|nr:flagellum transition zone component, putative [Trypanosoma cruzi marinkellei]
MDVADGCVLGEKTLEAEELEASADVLEPRTVRIPATTVSQEGEVIDAASFVPRTPFLSARTFFSSKTKRATDAVGPFQPSTLCTGDCFIPRHRLGLRGMTFKTQRKLSVSPSKKVREVGAPYKESHSKRFRDRVMDARECLSNDDRVLLLARERNDCKAELREKSEQIKKLEVALRAMRAQLAMDAVKPGSSVAEQENSISDLRVTRLVNENNDLEKNLREARAQISAWKRDARVSHLQELKLELAVYQSEVTRLYSMLQRGRKRDLRKSCVESRLCEALDAVKQKDDIIRELRDKLSENAAALSRSLEDAMRFQSTAEQLQEENGALCKELKVLRKVSIELTNNREELERTRADLRETRQELHEYKRLMGRVGSPAEIFTIIKERDALLNMLKEQNAREEAQRREFTRQLEEARENMEKCIQKSLQEERALAKDKEAQLRHTCRIWKEQYERLALDSATGRGLQEKEMQTQKERQEERQKELRLILSKVPLQLNEQCQSKEVQIINRLESQSVKSPVAPIQTPSHTGVTSKSSVSISNLPTFKGSHGGGGINNDRAYLAENVQQHEIDHSSIKKEEGHESCLSSQHGDSENDNHSNSSRLARGFQQPPAAAAVATADTIEEDEVFIMPTKGSPKRSESENVVEGIGSNGSGDLLEAPHIPVANGSSVEMKLTNSLTRNASPIADVASMSFSKADKSLENPLQISLKVPPSPPAAVPALPASDSSTSAAHLDSILSDVPGDSAGEYFKPKSRYPEEDLWETVSPVEEDESFTVHHVQL